MCGGVKAHSAGSSLVAEVGVGGDSIPTPPTGSSRAAPLKTFQLQILPVGHRHWKTTTACLDAYIALPSLSRHCRSAVFCAIIRSTEHQEPWKSRVPSSSRLSRTADSDSANHGPPGWTPTTVHGVRAWNRCRETWSQQQPAAARRGGAWQSSPTSLYPQGLAVTLHICYRWLAIVFLEEKTALRPRNSRPLAAVCRTKVTKADSGVGVVPSIANLRGRTRSQLA